MRIASEHGIDLEQVEGTGRGGRVRKQDVLAFLENGGAAARSRRCTSRARTGPTSRRRAKTRKPRFDAARPPSRRRMAARQRAAVAHAAGDRRAHAAVAADGGDLHHDRRGRPRPDRGGAREQTGFTYLPYIARATIDTLREFPQLNATLEDDTLTTYDGVHLGIAVSLGEGGLIVPVIRDAQELSRRGPGEADQGPRAARAGERSSRRTRSAAARSRSPTPAATARSSPRR